MKNLMTLFLMLCCTPIVNACSCDWGGNFIHVASTYGELVLKGKVIDHTWHGPNGRRFHNSDSAYNKYIEEMDSYDLSGIGESITVEIIEIIKGNEVRSIIEIFGSDGVDCRESVRQFKVGEFYVFSLYQLSGIFPNIANEQEGDFAMGACSENYIQYLDKTKQVRGKIKGKSHRRNVSNFSYSKLKEKITQYNTR